MPFGRRLILFVALLSQSLLLSARAGEPERRDSLVSLLSAQSMQLLEEDGVPFRKVTGPARFFHNDTYLLCDTALWNVNTDVIEAMGNVKILQNETVLTSDRLTYLINEDLAQFRGNLVQLEDKDHNILRTRNLDYNTRDSVGVFREGGAMRSSDGQIIESIRGTYDSKLKLFTFVDDVNMFTDSIFVKTTKLEYNTESNVATFGAGTDAWKDDAMLSSNAGWYDRNSELFLFHRDVHGMNPDKEVWSDSLYFHRSTLDLELLGNVQLDDTTRNVTALAGRAVYRDTVSQVDLTRRPAVVLVIEDKEAADTVWVSADTLRYRTVPRFQIDSSEFVKASTRLKDMSSDAVMSYRKKAAEDAAKAAEEARKNNADYIEKEQAAQARSRNAAKNGGGGKSSDSGTSGLSSASDGAPAAAGSAAGVPPPVKTLRTDAGADSLSVSADSLSVAGRPELPDTLSALHAVTDSTAAGRPVLPDSLSASRSPLPESLPDSLSAIAGPSAAALDSLSAAGDSLAVAKDTVYAPVDSTKIGFVTAINDVRLFKSEIQMRCDSLVYNDIDSLVRIHRNPLIWNDGNRQYSADSLYVSFGGGHLDKAYLQSSAFIVVQEDTLCFDQIRSTEMLAYFNADGELHRFDALGDASAVFYLKEDSTFATINKSQSRMMYAVLDAGELQSVTYFDNIKNDAYPIAQIKKEDRILKGFNWLPDNRPKGPRDITAYTRRPSRRKYYAARPHAQYRQTAIYFPGYMDGIYRQIAINDSLKTVRDAEKREREALAKQVAEADSLLAVRDTVSLPDSLGAVADSLTAVADTLAGTDSLATVRDSIAIADSLAAEAMKMLSPKEKAKLEKEARKKEKERLKAARDAAREAEWARLDSLDAVKAAKKAEARAEKIRQRKLKMLLAEQKRLQKEQEKIEAYMRKYEKQKAKEAERAARKAAKDAEKAARKAGKQAALKPEN